MPPTQSEKIYDCIVVGAGQAGLACGYYLKERDLSFIILDKVKEVGSSWKNRYDSLVLFTPNRYCQLPDAELPGEPNNHSTKDEIAVYLKNYAKNQNLPIIFEQKVFEIKFENNLYEILTLAPISSTSTTKYKSKSIILATGPFQEPLIPNFPGIKTLNTLQIHSADYKNPSQVEGKKVLVVGGGNSGAQIAEELSNIDHLEVYFSIKGRPAFVPQKILGKNVFWWLEKLNLLYAPKNSWRSKLLMGKSEPIIGTNLKSFIEKGKARVLPGVTGVEENQIIFEGEYKSAFDTIIWATGYRQNYDFLKIPNVLNEKGELRHAVGVTGQPGLYCIGHIWQKTRSSALVGGVGRDAEELVAKISAKLADLS